MTDPTFIATTIDIGTIKLIAKILRHERGDDHLDFVDAGNQIAAACKRLGAIRGSKPNA